MGGMKTIQDPARKAMGEGQQAAAKGESRKSNPYPEGILRDLWFDGFRDFKRQLKKASDKYQSVISVFDTDTGCLLFVSGTGYKRESDRELARAARLIGSAAKGCRKVVTPEESKARAARLASARLKRWPKKGES